MTAEAAQTRCLCCNTIHNGADDVDIAVFDGIVLKTFDRYVETFVLCHGFTAVSTKAKAECLTTLLLLLFREHIEETLSLACRIIIQERCFRDQQGFVTEL